MMHLAGKDSLSPPSRTPNVKCNHTRVSKKLVTISKPTKCNVRDHCFYSNIALTNQSKQPHNGAKHFNNQYPDEESRVSSIGQGCIRPRDSDRDTTQEIA